jgi:hypothetical protein
VRALHGLLELALAHLLRAAGTLHLLLHLPGLLVQLLHALAQLGRRLALFHGVLGLVRAFFDPGDPFLELFGLHLHVSSLK